MSGQIREAASLIVLRDGAQGLEVLMMRRPERGGDFRSGVWVFPGGVVDPTDAELSAHSHGLLETQANQRLGLSAGGLRHFVAALRECFEEAGLLYACTPQGEAAALGPQAAELHHWRERVHAGQAQLPDMLMALGLHLDLRNLAFFDHWLTPPTRPKRFDTRFFVAQAPAGQEAKADDREALELRWVRPDQAAADEQMKMLRVTRHLLKRVAEFKAAASGFEAALALRGVQRNSPQTHDTGGVNG